MHRLRARMDAILVGVGTVLADDPLLTARGVPVRRVALRVVLDGNLRTPLQSQLVRTAPQFPTVVVTTSAALRTPKAKRLVRSGIELMPCPTRAGLLSLSACLRGLASRNVTNLLIEGGPAVLASFLHAGLVDEAWIFTAPFTLNAGGRPGLESGLRPRHIQTVRSGRDTLAKLRLTEPPRRRS